MKFQKNDKYFTIALYTCFTSLFIIISTLLIFNYKEVFKVIFNALKTLGILFMPLLLGIVIAYLIDPIVEFYDKKCQMIDFNKLKANRFHVRPHSSKKQTRRRGRTLPTFLACLTLIAIIGVFILIIVMNVKEVVGSASLHNISASIKNYMSYFENMLLEVSKITEEFNVFPSNGHFIQEIYAFLNSLARNLSRVFLEWITGVGMNSLNILLAFVVAFYLLVDKELMLNCWNHIIHFIFPEKIYKQIKEIGHDIDYVFSGYIRGQVLDALIIAILTSAALTVIRLDFAIIIGLLAGIFNLIPYFGPVVGFVLAGLIGLLDPNPMKAVYGVIALMIIQQLDGWVIVPKVVGECVKLHPVVVLLSIIIGGNLFGLWGMLLGVPVAAFMRLIILRYTKDKINE